MLDGHALLSEATSPRNLPAVADGNRVKGMSEKTAHLLEEFESLPAAEKEAFTVELLAHAQAQGLPVPLYVERASRLHNGETLSPSDINTEERLRRARTAGAHIRELRKGLTLKGIKIKDLIEEGRM